MKKSHFTPKNRDRPDIFSSHCRSQTSIVLVSAISGLFCNSTRIVALKFFCENAPLYCGILFIELEKALRAFASSSGGAACPGDRGVGVMGQPRRSGGDPKVIYVSEKKICDARMNGHMDGQTCRMK